MQQGYIIVVNAGSSSVKCSVFSTAGECTYRIIVKGIGLSEVVSIGADKEKPDEEMQLDMTMTHTDALVYIRRCIAEREYGTPYAVGYRVVHGGGKYVASTRITSDILKDMYALVPLAPEHMPVQLAAIAEGMELYPQALHVACFDTAYHHALPRVASIIAIPRAAEAIGVRKYGFHGLSYTSVMSQLAAVCGAVPERVIVAHLGNGASIAAIHNGVSVDTTMGLTPASGIVMSTRSGDIDPGVISFLHRQQGLTLEEIDVLINKQSGLLGISGSTGDMRSLLARESTDVAAHEAVDVFCYTVKKYIGAYAAVLGGLDMLVFTGGIGEVAPRIRARVCAGLSWMGISLDEEKNTQSLDVISEDAARVPVRIVHTNEEEVIARECLRMV